MQYGPSVRPPVSTGDIGGRITLIPNATAAATAADVHRRGRNRRGSSIAPMRRASVLRSRKNSTQPARPADAVSPAAPHRLSTPTHPGRYTAAT